MGKVLKLSSYAIHQNPHHSHQNPYHSHQFPPVLTY